MATNALVPLYEIGADITCIATAAITGKRFVAIAGNGTLPNPNAAPAVAAARAFGVAAYDAVVGQEFPVKRSGVVPVTAGAAITANQEVEVGANGVAVPKAAGIAVGYALFDAANGASAYVHLYV